MRENFYRMHRKIANNRDHVEVGTCQVTQDERMERKENTAGFLTTAVESRLYSLSQSQHFRLILLLKYLFIKVIRKHPILLNKELLALKIMKELI